MGPALQCARGVEPELDLLAIVVDAFCNLIGENSLEAVASQQLGVSPIRDKSGLNQDRGHTGHEEHVKWALLEPQIGQTSIVPLRGPDHVLVNEAGETLRIGCGLVGSQASKSSWIDWEIKKAVELNKKIVAVKIKAANATPSALLGVGASWAMSFTFDSITKAINSAS